MKSDEHWMSFALALARRAGEANEVPVGAILVRDDALIGEAYNQTLGLKDPSGHAEILALRDAAQRVGNHRLINSTLFVTIEPCTMCAGALIHARVARLVYGAKEPKAGAVDSSIQVLANPSLNHRIDVSSGVCAEEAALLISSFFKSKRKNSD